MTQSGVLACGGSRREGLGESVTAATLLRRNAGPAAESPTANRDPRGDWGAEGIM